jgi:hypothetical protein
LAYREEIQSTNCPLCGRSMSIVNGLKDFSIQFCRTHGIFGVDKTTNDVWVLEGFGSNMAPIKRKWYTIENHKPLTIDRYREMVKWANLKRLEDI